LLSKKFYFFSSAKNRGKKSRIFFFLIFFVFCFFLKSHGVEDASLLGEVAGVFLALGLGLLGVGLVGGGEVSGAAAGLELQDALDDVAVAEAAGLHALLHDPGPGLLVGLDVAAVAHLLHEVHHGAELALALGRLGGGALVLALEDLAEDGVVGREVRGAVGKVHVDHDLAGVVVGLDGLDLLDPGGGVGLDFVAEKIELLAAGGLGGGAVVADLGEGGKSGGNESAAHYLLLLFSF
jgi:hypothetical protein